VAHEIAHAYGRSHAPCDASGRCDDPKLPDGNYPHYGIYPSDSIGEFGYDPIANAVKDPAVSFDYMGYSSSKWTSPYTYTGLMGSFPPTGAGPSGSSVSQFLIRRVTGRRSEGQGLLLRFTIQSEEDVEIEPSFSHEVRTIPLRRKSDWHVEQRTAAGDVLSSIPVSVRGNARHARRVRQLIPRSLRDDRLAIVYRGKDVLVEPFGEPPRVEGHVDIDEKSINISWVGDADVWAVVQGLDQQGVWRGLTGRTQEKAVRLDREVIRRRRYQQLRLLAVRRLATAIVDLPYEMEPKVAEATIVTKVVAPCVIKGWVIGDDGVEKAQLLWTDEHGREIGRGHTLDLRGRRPVGLIRVSARNASRYVASRAIALTQAPRSLQIARDSAIGAPHAQAIPAHPGKPQHEH